METVTVFRTFNGPEAHLVRSRLEAAGIPATVLHEGAALAVAGAGTPAVEILVTVGAEFAAVARELIEASHEPTLTPALSRPTGEGARRAGEGKSGRFMGDEQFRKEPGSFHEPPTPGGASLPPSHNPGDPDRARPQPRPAGFTAAAHDLEAKGTSPDRV